MQDIVVIIRNLEGEETFRYTGRIIEHTPERIILEAYFNRPDIPFHGTTLAKGDRFRETHYSDRWYNVFEIYSREDDRLKCWYCNIAFPAEFSEGAITYVDLELDLLVFPDGRQLVLDEEEFASLELPENISAQALDALKELKFSFQMMFQGQE